MMTSINGFAYRLGALPKTLEMTVNAVRYARRRAFR